MGSTVAPPLVYSRRQIQKQAKLHGAEQERSCLRADEDKDEFSVLRCSAVSADDSAATAPDGSTGVLDCGKRRAKKTSLSRNEISEIQYKPVASSIDPINCTHHSRATPVFPQISA